MDFEGDENKSAANFRKHGVTFLEASEAFADDFSSEVADPDHSEGEYRYLLFGKTDSDKYVVVSYTERDERIRIISARNMTRSERKAYEQ